jgi:hypothetical protein
VVDAEDAIVVDGPRANRPSRGNSPSSCSPIVWLKPTRSPRPAR